jgi:hypothetical protein
VTLRNFPVEELLWGFGASDQDGATQVWFYPPVLVLTPRDAGALRDAGVFTDGSLVPDAETSTFVVVRVADG